MKARFFIDAVENQGPQGSFFVGVVKSGELRCGMEAGINGGLVIVRRITIPDQPMNFLDSAKKGSRVMIGCENIGCSPDSKLEKTSIDFTDEKSIPLKKAIFLTPEAS